MDGDVGVERARCDCEGMPLRARHRRNLNKEPLAGFVTHAGFAELDLHGIVRMANHFEDLS